MKKKANNKVRLNVRLPAELVEWIKGYVLENNTTVTQVIISHLMELKVRTETGQVDQF